MQPLTAFVFGVDAGVLLMVAAVFVFVVVCGATIEPTDRARAWRRRWKRRNARRGGVRR